VNNRNVIFDSYTHVSTGYDTYIVVCKFGNFYIIFLYHSFSQLTQLEKLDIGRNPLNTVRYVVSSLTSLKQLNMKSCGISSLPEWFVCHMFIATTQHKYSLDSFKIYL